MRRCFHQDRRMAGLHGSVLALRNTDTLPFHGLWQLLQNSKWKFAHGVFSRLSNSTQLG